MHINQKFPNLKRKIFLCVDIFHKFLLGMFFFIVIPGGQPDSVMNIRLQRLPTANEGNYFESIPFTIFDSFRNGVETKTGQKMECLRKKDAYHQVGLMAPTQLMNCQIVVDQSDCVSHSHKADPPNHTIDLPEDHSVIFDLGLFFVDIFSFHLDFLQIVSFLLLL